MVTSVSSHPLPVPLAPLQDQVSSTAGLIPAVHSLAAFTAAPPGRAHQPGWAQHPQFAPFMAGAAPGWGVPTGGPPAQGPAAHYGGVPPMAWVGPDLAPPQCDPVMAGYSPAAATLPPEQQQALLYQQQAVFMQQQASYYQQAAAVQQYMRQAQQAQPRQHGGAAVAHADEPVFTREPPPVLPIALDASGRPFKVSPTGAAPACSKKAEGMALCQRLTRSFDSLPPWAQVCHGVAVRGMRRPEHYQADGRPAWTR